jgi:upstream activation factor subunit UAF30
LGLVLSQLFDNDFVCHAWLIIGRLIYLCPNAEKSGKGRGSNSGWKAHVALHPRLSEFLGVETIARTDITKALWVYIKANDLQDPKDRRKILCDEKLKKLFNGKERVDMFKMTKLISEVK